MKLKKYSLAIALALDGIIAVGFGLFSWINPDDSFGYIFAIPEGHDGLFLSLFSSLSLFYITIGLVCFIGIDTKHSTSKWIALLMILRHIFEGMIKVGDMNEEWLIGDPYPDLIIHVVFVIAYVIFLYKKWDLAHMDTQNGVVK